MSHKDHLQVTIRDIQPSDHSTIADFTIYSLDFDYWNFLRPYRHQFPFTYRDQLLRITKGASLGPDRRVFVAEIEEEEKEEDGIRRVVGWAGWRVHKTNPEILHDETWNAPSWTQEKGRSFEGTLLSIEDKYISLFNLDRTLSPSAAKALQESRKQDPFAAVGPTIELTHLVVDQRYGRRGIGAQLVKRGIEIAQKEGLPICLKASAAGRGLYSKLGFEVFGTVEIMGGPSLPCMVLRPGHKQDSAIVEDVHDANESGEMVPMDSADLSQKLASE